MRDGCAGQWKEGVGAVNVDDRSRDAHGRFAKENTPPPVAVSARKPEPPPASARGATQASAPKTLADITLPGQETVDVESRGRHIIATVLTEYMDSRPTHHSDVAPASQKYSVSERVTQARRAGQKGAVLSFLSRDPNSDVRCGVAQNTETEEEVLAFLGENDFDTAVLAAVARHWHTSSETLAHMGRRLRGADRWVEKLALIGNANTPESTVETLADDPDPAVRERARARLRKVGTAQ